MEQPAGIGEQETAPPRDSGAKLTVLSEGPESEVEMPCRIELHEGRKMRLRVPRPIPLDTALRIEAEDSLWLGQTEGCREEAAGFAVEVHISHFLRHLPELSRMAERFRGAGEGRRRADSGPVNSNE